MNKVVRDGKVAVLVSHGYGAGWFSWNREHLQCLFDPDIVGMVEARADTYAIEEKAKETYGDGFYPGGARGLEIHWVPEGAEFQVEEYDGAEGLSMRDEQSWVRA